MKLCANAELLGDIREPKDHIKEWTHKSAYELPFHKIFW